MLEGDVFETAKNLQGPFDILFLDIWASDYLKMFEKVELLLAPGVVVLADNMFTVFEDVKPFHAYLAANPNISDTTLPFESGLEFGVIV